MTLPTLTDQQTDGVKSFSRWYKGRSNPFSFEQVFRLAGFAGTGKSTILPFLIEDIGIPVSTVAFCAPTGKAAKVMGQKLRAFGIYNQPTTIHKLIYMPKGARAEQIDQEMRFLQAQYDRHYDESVIEGRDPDNMVVIVRGEAITGATVVAMIEQLKQQLAREMLDSGGPAFVLRNEDEFPEHIKLIVVDEASMVGNDVARDLETFGRPILAIGDPGQLPPVKDMCGFDMEEADFFLTEIHRQAADNPIIYLATQVREGNELKIGDYGEGVQVLPRSRDRVTYDMDRDAMVVVGTHKKRWMITHNIRKTLGIRSTGPVEGEPLIIRRNSKNHPGLVNGTIVRCLKDAGDLIEGHSSLMLRVVDDEVESEYSFLATQGLLEEHLYRKRGAYSCEPQKAFFANRNYEHVDFAHAITCHSAQGSQWDEVIVHDESSVFREEASRWLYTAVTRAAERLTVLV